uniref:Uncharacterized protein n=1 Tax=Opuntia streptacantha TaxID=393608 RepID=A0A7C9E539_OPUST
MVQVHTCARRLMKSLPSPFPKWDFDWPRCCRTYWNELATLFFLLCKVINGYAAIKSGIKDEGNQVMIRVILINLKPDCTLMHIDIILDDFCVLMIHINRRWPSIHRWPHRRPSISVTNIRIRIIGATH